MSGSRPIGNKRQAVNPDKGKIAKKQAATDPKSHSLGKTDTFVTEQIGSNTALTVG
jgi:hypothetical protein